MMATAEQRCAAFLEALATADDQEFCSPPGLGGTWRTVHIKDALERGILVNCGWGIAYARVVKNSGSTHGVCQSCSGKRDVCIHCSCVTCVWERRAAETGGPPATKAQVDALRVRLAAFQFSVATAPSLAE